MEGGLLLVKLLLLPAQIKNHQREQASALPAVARSGWRPPVQAGGRIRRLRPLYLPPLCITKIDSEMLFC